MSIVTVANISDHSDYVRTRPAPLADAITLLLTAANFSHVKYVNSNGVRYYC